MGNQLLQERADPYHVVAAILSGKPLCECGQPAVYKGSFDNFSGSGNQIANAMLLCEKCAAECDQGVTLKLLQDRPWERI